RHGAGAGAYESGNTGGVADNFPGLIGLVGVVAKVHLHEDVAREQLPLDHFLLAGPAVFHGFFRGDDDLVDGVRGAKRAGATENVFLCLFLVPDISMDGIPLDTHMSSLSAFMPPSVA